MSSSHRLNLHTGLSYSTSLPFTGGYSPRIFQQPAREDTEPFDGIVEVDETFVGGKTEGQGRGYKGIRLWWLAW
jgi:hypothetical protein